MPAKGSSKQCCCGGCATVPVDLAISERELQPLQQYCCACMPLQICVHYECDGESSFELFDARIFCDGGGTEAIKYTGDIIVDGELAHLEFYFAPDSEYGTCDFCLTSDDLGIYSDCKEITDEVRAALCPRCTPCPESSDPKVLTWDVPAAACSGSATISISPAANTSISAHPACCGCDPCDQEPYVDDEEPYDQSCGGLCGGCGCLCTVACITVVRHHEIHTQEVAQLCRWKYRTETGIVITLVQNYSTGCCELELTSTGDIVPNEELANVFIGGVSNPCPNPVGRWDFTDGGLSDPDNQVTVLFECATCLECPGVLTSTCCDEVASLPWVLTATAVGSAGCCGTIELLLVYNRTEGAWIGLDENSMCGHSISLRLNCGSPDWQLTFSGGPCTEQTVTANVGGTCSPLNLEFTVPLNGLACCSGAGSGTLTVTITE